MSKNIFDFLFVLSLIAPIAALVVGAFALAIPMTRLRWRTPERAEHGSAREPGEPGVRGSRGHAFRGQAAR